LHSLIIKSNLKIIAVYQQFVNPFEAGWATINIKAGNTGLLRSSVDHLGRRDSMKPVVGWLVIWCLLVPLQPASAEGNAKQTVVTITADQVDGANDIEAAIILATAEGTRPGTVILDGKNGAFAFTDPDKSLNLFVSDLTLRGVNHARIENCGDGLFFDDFPLRNIVVEGIAFFCTGSGVVAAGGFRFVTLRNNLFQVERIGIGLGGASSDWAIKENVIDAQEDGILILGARRVVIAENHISSVVGINLEKCAQFEVRKNTIQAFENGILLVQGSGKNWVQGNTIWGVHSAGIGLEAGGTGNRILANRVFCAAGAACQTVNAAPEAENKNSIAGNSP
jgi:hypothetical protein